VSLLRAFYRRKFGWLSGQLEVSWSPSFDEHARQLTQRYGVLLVSVVVGLVFIGWPTDFFNFRGNAAHFQITLEFRIAMLLWALVAVVIAKLTEGRQRWVYRSVVLLAAAASAITGVTTSRYGDLHTMYFHYSYVLPFLVLILPTPLVARTWTSMAVSCGFAIAYFAYNPQHGDAGVITPLTTLAATTFGSIALGHGYFRMLRRNHQQRVVLNELNCGLEERVNERTTELRRFAAHVETSREDERKRIGRELHDELAQLLTAMRVELKLAARHRTEPEHLKHSLSRIDEILELCFGAKDRIVTALRPPELDELGFAVAVRQLANTVASRSGIEIRVAMEDDVHIADDTATAAFRVLQEALTNVTRHASASCVDVEVVCSDRNLDMVVTDDGNGFDPSTLGDGGFGVLGMRERADALSGRMSIDSQPGQGTRLHLTLPVVSSSRATEHNG
jgi:signal transduction histidine kinase